MSAAFSIAHAVVRFRDDLRVSDHPALVRAAESGRPVIGAYVFDERAGARPLGGAARWRLHGSLRALDAALAAWRRRATGYPFVDAGMRELWATGWMHNRARMVCAPFLVKHLLID